MTTEQKFLFCHEWFTKYQNSGKTNYNSIMDVIFTGSKVSSNFIGCTITYRNADSSWNRYEKRQTAPITAKFLDKMYSIVSELPQE